MYTPVAVPWRSSGQFMIQMHVMHEGIQESLPHKAKNSPLTPFYYIRTPPLARRRPPFLEWFNRFGDQTARNHHVRSITFRSVWRHAYSSKVFIASLTVLLMLLSTRPALKLCKRLVALPHRNTWMKVPIQETNLSFSFPIQSLASPLKILWNFLRSINMSIAYDALFP